MREYKNENWVKNDKKWLNIRMKIGTNFGFFDGKKWGKIRIKIGSNFCSPIYACPE